MIIEYGFIDRHQVYVHLHTHMIEFINSIKCLAVICCLNQNASGKIQYRSNSADL